MNQRWMALCGLSFALVMMSGQSLAGPNLAPVPLVTPQHAPSQALLASWSHVKSYTGNYSADVETSADGGWHEHFAGTLVLAPMCPMCRTQSWIPVWMGNTTTTQSATGKCGSANTGEPTQVVLSVNLPSQTYQLSFIPNPGSVKLRGGDPKCTQPFTSVFPVAQFSIAKAPLPVPSAGICGTKTIYRSGAGWNESDTFHWMFAPKTDMHWKSIMSCPNSIDGAPPLH
jgi:hypothetical protein